MSFNVRWLVVGAMALVTGASPLASESSVSWLLRTDKEIRDRQHLSEPKGKSNALTSRGLTRALAIRTHRTDYAQKPMK